MFENHYHAKFKKKGGRELFLDPVQNTPDLEPVQCCGYRLGRPRFKQTPKKLIISLAPVTLAYHTGLLLRREDGGKRTAQITLNVLKKGWDENVTSTS